MMDDNCEILEMFKKLGVSLKDSEGRWRDTQEVLKDMIDAWNNAEEEDKLD